MEGIMLRLAPASSQFNTLILLSPLPLCRSEKCFLLKYQLDSLYLVWKPLVYIVFPIQSFWTYNIGYNFPWKSSFFCCSDTYLWRAHMFWRRWGGLMAFTVQQMLEPSLQGLVEQWSCCNRILPSLQLLNGSSFWYKHFLIPQVDLLLW